MAGVYIAPDGSLSNQIYLQSKTHLKQLIKAFSICRNFQAGVLELNLMHSMSRIATVWPLLTDIPKTNHTTFK